MPDTPVEKDVIWTATADEGEWLVDVYPIESNAYRGTLVVVHVPDSKEILREEVSVSFGAPFGPDQEDVNLWGHMAIEVIDQYLAQHPKGGADDGSS